MNNATTGGVIVGIVVLAIFFMASKNTKAIMVVAGLIVLVLVFRNSMTVAVTR